MLLSPEGILESSHRKLVIFNQLRISIWEILKWIIYSSTNMYIAKCVNNKDNKSKPNPVYLYYLNKSQNLLYYNIYC